MEVPPQSDPIAVEAYREQAYAVECPVCGFSNLRHDYKLTCCDSCSQAIRIETVRYENGAVVQVIRK